MIEEGREIFRYDTFGDEDFWGGTLRLHEALAGLTPADALGLGLKVDADALKPRVRKLLSTGQLDLEDPKVTAELLRSNAVLGVTGFFDSKGSLVSVGIQCALCHSTVDDSLTTGVGHRLDGWANRDLNVGAIIASAPDLSFIAGLLGTDVDTVKTVLNSWGPGKFDAELLLDGQAFAPGNKPAATLIPPAFGLAGHNNHTWTGAWGTVSYWNAFVANLEMRGKGTFFDPRLDNASQYPVAAANPELFGHKRDEVDLITSKLPALHFYQLSIPAPPPPPGSFDPVAASRGDDLFGGKAKCAGCHVEPLFTEPGWNLHPAEDVCVDDFQSKRGPDQVYRTSPLNGLWTHQKGGFFHDGRFATLLDVMNHYNDCFDLKLTEREKLDVVEYLKSLPEAEE
jgi:cytochrome c peroxidase